MVSFPVMARRRPGEGAFPGTATAALLLMAVTASGQQEEGDVATENGGGEPSKNSSLAMEVEKWLPMFLGLVLGLAVVGWCSLNIYRAMKTQDEEEEEAAANVKAFGSNGNGGRLKSFRGVDIEMGGPGTGDVSPEAYSYQSTNPQRGPSLRGASLRSSSFRGSAAVSGNHGVLHGAGAGAMIPNMIFKGDELQGKKAPGEDGNVYQNPMQRSRGVSTPDTGNATDSTAHSSGTISVSSRWSAAKPSLSATSRPTRGGGGGGGGDYGDDDDDTTDGGGETGRRGAGAGAGHRRKPTATATAKEKQQAGRMRQQQAGSSRAGGGRSKSRSSTERRGSGRGGGTDESSHYSTAEEDGDAQGSNLSRHLRPAVLRAARPIPRNSSSGGVERAGRVTIGR